VDPSLLGSLSPDAVREALPDLLSRFVGDESEQAPSASLLRQLLAERTDAELADMLEHLSAVGDEPKIYRAEPTCQRLVRAWSQRLLTLEVIGVKHLVSALAAGPTALLGNHLSYFDTCALDCALAWSGQEDAAARIVAAAGPKVYADPFRRFVASSLNTLPVPQSTSFAHTEPLSPRELARRAQASVQTAHQALRDGLALLIYPEGSRSRSTRLTPFLPAVRRYLELDGLQVVPVAVSGTERFLPVDDVRVHPGSVRVAFGTPIAVSARGGREALDHAYEALSALLPEAYQPLGG